jgi:purine-binding chemotaxis protein CheW
MSNAVAKNNGNENAEEGHQYLTFHLDDEEYGIDILRVQEIRGWEKVRPLPDTPGYILGIMSLRGEVIPVVDLRLRFGLAHREPSELTVVIIVRVDHGGESRGMGLVVDAVSEVYRIDASQRREPPKFGGAINADMLHGVGMVDENMIFLLDLDRLVRQGVLEEAAAAQA